MKKLIFISALLVQTCAYAEIITLKDGTRLEGAVEGEMDGVNLIRTKYGSLNIAKKDILSIGAPEIVVKEPFNTPASSAAAPADLPAGPAPEPRYTFKTVNVSTSALEKVYFENGVVTATETYDSRGTLLGLQGLVKDGSYREYYDNGNLKTEKTVINSKTSGPLRAYYPGGVLQSEAYYLDGALNGTVRVYNENARLLFEQNFRGGVPNGWFREFNETGELKSELFYADGHAAEKPKAAEAKTPEAAAAPETPDSMVTAKAVSLARGERFTFYLNNKYIARITLDRDFNLISKDGKAPDGAVKIYTKDGKLEKEFLFSKNEVVSLKIYNENGNLKNEYTFNKKGEAAKKQ
ncbi:MAG: hypothetical protein A2X28_01015 [Elusimicrobia bacterium GWA2_56_46]|nr:MAG: hypothetical protein A2X28_01015 [Elusimicrobia bacterium GWA2_56_46]OGR55942.1 MAG: hypothetical protein A2X39_06380 [Elusimicrobia bacterium GWC2_56_31]HBB67898.1 hypothetical protein [Elusimicrobiota bacterium]HBW22120.1 hypothetical protein [Elusimicrobiota bacterium]